MFKSKAEVDKHVGRMLNRLKTKNEINRECLKIANLYYDVMDYENARIYLIKYLSDHQQDASAWELMGDLAKQNEKNPLKAIDNYAECLKLNEANNKRVLLKICECYLSLNDENKMNSANLKEARKWLEKAQKYFPYEACIVDLKEMILSSLVESFRDQEANLAECQSMRDDWESFLCKALEQNPLDLDLNLKLIKTYLSLMHHSSDVYSLRAFNKILQNELVSAFYFPQQPVADPIDFEDVAEIIQERFVYHETLYRLLDTTSQSTNARSIEYINLIKLLILKQLILLKIKSSDHIGELIDLFHNYASVVSELEAYVTKILDTTESQTNLFKSLLDEHKSHVFYLTGLFLLKMCSNDDINATFQTSDSDDANSTNEVHSSSNVTSENNCVLAVICFINSLKLSKPNEQFYLKSSNMYVQQHQHNMSDRELDLTHINAMLIQCHNRDSAWRYSIISHWLRHKLIANRNKVNFFKKIASLSQDEQIKQKIDAKFLIKDERSTFTLSKVLDQIQLRKHDLQNFNESTIFSIIDEASLVYADKLILTNQNSNLNYLVWHNLANSIQKNSKLITNSNESGATSSNIIVFPYFVIHYNLKSKKHRKIQFGAENLNLCNTDSLSLIDMKLFAYSTSLQASSYLNDDLMPYWLQTELCKTYQQSWWSQAISYLLPAAKSKSKNEQSSNLKQLIELMRLKSNVIKINQLVDGTRSSTRFEQYKQNRIILLKLTLYLQHLVNALNNKFATAKVGAKIDDLQQLLNDESDDFSDNSLILNSLIGNEFETEYSPKHKFDCLNRYLLQYWTFMCDEFIKLKQIRGACIDLDSETDMTRLDNDLEDLVDIKEYDDDNDMLQANDTRKLKSYFNYSFQRHIQSQTVNKMLINENLFIQTGLLELILDSVRQLDAELSDDTFEMDFNDLVGKLDNALRRFELIEINLNETHLNSYQLENCKKIGQLLVKLRDKYESLLNDSSKQEPIKDQKYAELLGKLNCLIEYLKNRFNKNFSSNKAQLLNKLYSNGSDILTMNRIELISQNYVNDESDLANLSLGEWLKQSDPLSRLNDFGVPAEPIKTINSDEAVMDTKVSQVCEEPSQLQQEQTQQTYDLKTPSRPNETILPIENKDHHIVKPDGKIKLDDDDEVNEKKESNKLVSPIAKEEIQFESESELMTASEVASTLLPLAQQEQNHEDNESKTPERVNIAENLEKELQNSRKIADLIRTLKTERSEQRFKFNRDILKEQFLTVDFQFKQLNQEIKSLENCCFNRNRILDEFRSIVDAMNLNYSNMDAFYKQFNIFFWLFQNQPNCIDEFFKNQDNFDFQSIKQFSANNESINYTPTSQNIYNR